jgi:thioredoxin-like negative regulator of GroEL
MNEVGVRLAIILVLSLSVLGLVWLSQRFVERIRRQASSSDLILTPEELGEVGETTMTRVRILAFASEDCHQCHALQTPVLRRIKEAHGDTVTVIEIDASKPSKLTSHYHVLTVPTTVLLDTKGKAHAVNYGFTNAQSLLKQVDEILGLDDMQEAVP